MPASAAALASATDPVAPRVPTVAAGTAAASNEALARARGLSIIARSRASPPRSPVRLERSGPGMATAPSVSRPAAATAMPPPGLQAEANPRADRDQRLAADLERAAQGDADAFERFYDGTFGYARMLARRLLRGADVDDLLADVYFEAWRHASRFDARRGGPVTWLLTMVRSRALDALRAQAARPPAAGAGDDATAADLPDDGGDPADQLWQRQGNDRLHRALATLSAAERWVLGLAYLREMTQTEIAAATGMPIGTVKSHALRAQSKLRALLSTTFGRDEPGLA